MCLSIPGEVISINRDMAEVNVGGNIFNIGIQLLDNLSTGDFVMIHSGFAIQKIDKKEAEIIRNLTDEMKAK